MRPKTYPVRYIEIDAGAAGVSVAAGAYSNASMVTSPLVLAGGHSNYLRLHIWSIAAFILPKTAADDGWLALNACTIGIDLYDSSYTYYLDTVDVLGSILPVPLVLRNHAGAPGGGNFSLSQFGTGDQPLAELPNGLVVPANAANGLGAGQFDVGAVDIAVVFNVHNTDPAAAHSYFAWMNALYSLEE